MEQRQHPRFLVRMRTILGPPDAVEQEGTVYNVSVGGCAVLAEHLRGTDMMTSLHLYPSPATEPIIIAGAVRRWGKGPLHCYEFLSMTTDNHERLRLLLADLQTNQDHRSTQD
jgi:PilZ domain-containing protein